MNGLDRTAKLLRSHRRQWVSATALMKSGGLLSWRTRVSEARRLLGMEIENKVVKTKQGTRSYYRYSGKRAA